MGRRKVENIQTKNPELNPEGRNRAVQGGKHSDKESRIQP